MTVPPHPHPYPPPGYPYGSPPPRMPGLTTTAIVLMWVMVTLSAFGALLTIPVLAVIEGPFGTRVTVPTAITAGQGLIAPTSPSRSRGAAARPGRWPSSSKA
jgi:hypothetical protein